MICVHFFLSLPFFNHYSSVQYASNIHGYNARYAAKHNLYKPNVRTNVGKQLISFMATDIWKELPAPLKKAHTKCVCFSEANYTSLFTVRTTNELTFFYVDHVTYVNMLRVNKFFLPFAFCFFLFFFAFLPAI